MTAVAQVSEFVSPELADVALKALDRSDAPVTARGLARKLTGPFRQAPEKMSALLEAMADEGRVHRYPPFRGHTQYWTRGPDEFARGKVLAALAKGPRTHSELKPPKAVSREDWQAAIARLLETGEVRKHPPLPGARSERFGVDAPDPADYVRPLLDGLCKKLVSAGFPQEEILRTARRLADLRLQESAPAERPAQAPPDADGALQSLILERIPAIEPAAERGALVAIRDLRRSLEFQDASRAAFDRAMLELGRQGRVALHRHDFSDSLTVEERDELVSDGRGNYYMGVALRIRPGEST